MTQDSTSARHPSAQSRRLLFTVLTVLGIVALVAISVALILGAAFLLPSPTQPPDTSVLVPGTEDTYAVADIAAPDDPQGLRTKTFGNLDFVKVWYAFQIQNTEQVVSLGLFKFNLAALQGKDIHTAHLQLFAQRADLAQPARLVDVSVADGAWNEQQLSWSNLPQVATPPLSTAAVYGANVWYSWDITQGVLQKQRDGSVTLAVGLRTLDNKTEEQVIFASHRAARNTPRLMVTYPAFALLLPPYIYAAIGVIALWLLAGAILLATRRRGTRVLVQQPMAPRRRPVAGKSTAPVGPEDEAPTWDESLEPEVAPPTRGSR